MWLDWWYCYRSYVHVSCMSILCSMIGCCQTNVEWCEVNVVMATIAGWWVCGHFGPGHFGPWAQLVCRILAGVRLVVLVGYAGLRTDAMWGGDVLFPNYFGEDLLVFVSLCLQIVLWLLKNATRLSSATWFMPVFDDVDQKCLYL